MFTNRLPPGHCTPPCTDPDFRCSHLFSLSLSLLFFVFFFVTGALFLFFSPSFVPFNPQPSSFLLVPPPTRGPHRDILSVLFAGTSGVRTKGTRGPQEIFRRVDLAFFGQAARLYLSIVMQNVCKQRIDDRRHLGLDEFRRRSVRGWEGRSESAKKCEENLNDLGNQRR